MTTISDLAALAGIGTTSFILALSGALMPGPLFTVTVAEAARRGAHIGPLVITGHALLELLMMLALLAGLGPLLSAGPVVAGVAFLGGGMLLWMGVDMVRKAAGQSLADIQANAPTKGRHPIILGVLTSLANPYWTIWWATVGLGYLVTARHFGVAGVTVFFLGHIAADYAWYILVAQGASRGRAVLHDRVYQLLIQGCGVFLAGFGVWFLADSLRHFRQLVS